MGVVDSQQHVCTMLNESDLREGFYTCSPCMIQSHDHDTSCHSLQVVCYIIWSQPVIEIQWMLGRFNYSYALRLKLSTITLYTQ